MIASLGRTLIYGGVMMVLLGVVLVFSERIPFLGRLPGDFVFKGEKFRFYLPLASCLLLSLLISFLMNLFLKR